MPKISDVIPLTEAAAVMRERYGVAGAHYDACWRAVRSGAVRSERLGRAVLIRREDLPALAQALDGRPRPGRRPTAT